MNNEYFDLLSVFGSLAIVCLILFRLWWVVGSRITVQLTLRRVLADDQRIRDASIESGKAAIRNGKASRRLNDRMYGLYADMLFWSGIGAADLIRALISVGIIVGSVLSVFYGCIMTGLFGLLILVAAILGFVTSSFSSPKTHVDLVIRKIASTIYNWNTANPIECEYFCCKKRPRLMLVYKAVLDL